MVAGGSKRRRGRRAALSLASGRLQAVAERESTKSIALRAAEGPPRRLELAKAERLRAARVGEARRAQILQAEPPLADATLPSASLSRVRLIYGQTSGASRQPRRSAARRRL